MKTSARNNVVLQKHRGSRLSFRSFEMPDEGQAENKEDQEELLIEPRMRPSGTFSDDLLELQRQSKSDDQIVLISPKKKERCR